MPIFTQFRSLELRLDCSRASVFARIPSWNTESSADTDLTVSAICLGSMTWGQQNTEAEGHEQLDYALDCGVNFIDTAEIYSIPPRPETQGSTERIIGTWLAARRNRDKVIIATKVAGPRRRALAAARRRAHPVLDRKNIHYAIDGSLKRLQTDYVDLYQLALAGPLAAALGRGRNDLSAARRRARKFRSRRRWQRSTNW